MGDGVVVVDKPAGMTSHDVVDRVRKIFKTKKVGHAGTLDPDATGVLLLGINRATRFLSYAQASPKSYRTVAVFGVTTSTQDAAGEILEERPVALSGDDVAAAMKDFLGTIDQIPPMVSAVKIGGERLYKKARRGEEVERKPRSATIFEFALIDFDSSRAEATLEVRCSGGTYVRTLVHDLGQKLGCGAHLRALRRTAAGGFSEADTVPLSDVSESSLLPLVETVRELPRIEIDDEAGRLVGNGRPLVAPGDVAADGCVALTVKGRLVAVYKRNGDALVPDRVVGS
ncbi:MAG: tRNA pseudouridine(55) synthase TruB [Actinomycetota bacterium]